MKNQLTRMKPDSANMATQPGTKGVIEILCTECGWEDACMVPTAPWTIFKDHPCRLIMQSVSTGF
jgi:hypothetical protein